MERRDFIRLGALTGGLLVIGGCKELVEEPAIQFPDAEFKLLISPEVGYELHTGKKIFDRVPINAKKSLGTLDDSNYENIIIQNEIDFKQAYSPSVLYREVHSGLTPMIDIANNRSNPIQERSLVDTDIFILEPQTDNKKGLNGWGAGGSIRNYYIRLSLEKHYVGGCIAKNVWHVGALINNTNLQRNQLVFDLHLVGWRNGWNICFGAYESKSGWCRSTCGSDIWRAVRDYVYAIVIAYVSYSVAIAIAEFIATVATPVIIGAALL